MNFSPKQQMRFIDPDGGSLPIIGLAEDDGALVVRLGARALPPEEVSRLQAEWNPDQRLVSDMLDLLKGDES